MSERIFSDLTKTNSSEPGQAPVLGAGETIDFDVILASFQPPYQVTVKAEGSAGTVQRAIFGLVLDEEVQIQALASVSVGGAAVIDDLTTQGFSRLRVKLVAGSPPPNGRVLVQVNGVGR